jgi:hypothetical protein
LEPGFTYPSPSSIAPPLDFGSAILALSVASFWPCSGSVFRPSLVRSAFIRCVQHRLRLFSLASLRCISFPQMLKAIWPSIARLPNHFPSSANITTSGTCVLDPAPKSEQHLRCLFYRDDLLLSLLAHSVPFYARLATEDTLAVFCQGNHSATDMVGVAYLGVCQSAPKQWDSCTKD